MIKSASPSDLHRWLASGDAVLVDVREPEEYADAHIEGAVLLPLSTVTLAGIPSHQGKKIVMQCHLGGRSRAACGSLLNQDPTLDIYNLEGGIAAWAREGFAVKN